MPEQRAGILAGLAAYLLWGLLTVYWKALSGLPAFELIGQRILWSLVMLGLVIAVTRTPAGLGHLRHDPGLFVRVVLAAVLLAANWTTYVWCVTRGEVVETALGYSSPHCSRCSPAWWCSASACAGPRASPSGWRGWPWLSSPSATGACRCSR